MASWDAGRSTAAFAAGDIPQDAIRLRILANSDTANDQWIKHKVRDAVVDQMNQWVGGPQTVEEAREMIRSRLPELETLVGDVLTQYGYTYGAQVELGKVPFPTKMYGDKVYPAGDYEALRISLGKGEGQNWWCVLFPPLCFVDAVSNEAVAAKTDDGGKVASETGAGAGAGDKPAGKSGETSGERSAGKAADTKAPKLEKTSGTSASGKPVALAKAGDGKAAPVAMAVTAAQQQEEGKTEYKFFLWELLKKLISLFK
jgi:stage II sporulation protein R